MKIFMNAVLFDIYIYRGVIHQYCFREVNSFLFTGMYKKKLDPHKNVDWTKTAHAVHTYRVINWPHRFSP